MRCTSAKSVIWIWDCRHTFQSKHTHTHTHTHTIARLYLSEARCLNFRLSSYTLIETHTHAQKLSSNKNMAFTQSNKTTTCCYVRSTCTMRLSKGSIEYLGGFQWRQTPAFALWKNVFDELFGFHVCSITCTNMKMVMPRSWHHCACCPCQGHDIIVHACHAQIIILCMYACHAIIVQAAHAQMIRLCMYANHAQIIILCVYACHAIIVHAGHAQIIRLCMYASHAQVMILCMQAITLTLTLTHAQVAVVIWFSVCVITCTRHRHGHADVTLVCGKTLTRKSSGLCKPETLDTCMYVCTYVLSASPAASILHVMHNTTAHHSQTDISTL